MIHDAPELIQPAWQESREVPWPFLSIFPPYHPLGLSNAVSIVVTNSWNLLRVPWLYSTPRPLGADLAVNLVIIINNYLSPDPGHVSHYSDIRCFQPGRIWPPYIVRWICSQRETCKVWIFQHWSPVFLGQTQRLQAPGSVFVVNSESYSCSSSCSWADFYFQSSRFSWLGEYQVRPGLSELVVENSLSLSRTGFWGYWAGKEP